MSQPWIIAVDDLTVKEPVIRISSHDQDEFAVAICDAEHLARELTRVVEMIQRANNPEPTQGATDAIPQVA